MERTDIEQFVYDRMTQDDSKRSPTDPMRKSAYEPCCIEHEWHPGRICILPLGHL